MAPHKPTQKDSLSTSSIAYASHFGLFGKHFCSVLQIHVLSESELLRSKVVFVHPTDLLGDFPDVDTALFILFSVASK